MNQKTIESFDNVSITKVINDLIQSDIDIYHAYHHAAKEVKDKEIKSLFLNFAAEHEMHANSLSKAVLELGGHPPAFSRDFKGFVTSGYVAVKITGGKHKALEAIETNEKISNEYYIKALTVYMPEKIKQIIRMNLTDEESHLKHVRELKHKCKK